MRPVAIAGVVVAWIHLWAVCAAVVAAAAKIETILASGPICSVSGAIVGLWGLRCRNLSLAIFGFSATTLSGAVFLLINILEWGPGEAHLPVTLLLLGYELLIAPIGCLAIHWLLSDSQQAIVRPIRQFNIRTLLQLTLLAAVVCAAIRYAMQQQAGPLVMIAAGLAATIIVTTFAVTISAILRRLRLAECAARSRRSSAIRAP